MENVEIAENWLKQAIIQKSSEYPIRQYIKFVNSLPELEQNKILSTKKVKRLINKINRFVEYEIELGQARSLP